MKRHGLSYLLIQAIKTLFERPVTKKEIVARQKYTRGVPILHPEKCIGCGLCYRSCPSGAIEMRVVDRKKIGNRIIPVRNPSFDYYRCIRCEVCAEVCPVKAIEIVRRVIIRFSSEQK